MIIPIFDFASINVRPRFGALHEHYGQLLYLRKFSMGGGPDIGIAEDAALIRAYGDLLGGYHWCDPTQNATRQADYFLRMIDLHRPIVLMFDVEQAWPWKADHRNFDYSVVLPAAQILDNARRVVEHVRAATDLPYLIYTGRWFTISYCPDLGAWIAAQPAMIASYPDYYFLWPKPEHNGGIKAREPYRLAEYDQFGAAPANLFEYLARMQSRWMAVPTGVTNVKIWQISSRLILPDCVVPYDLSRWEGTLEEFRAFLRLPPLAPILQAVYGFAARAYSNENIATPEEDSP
jgi:hypothetical protein